MHYRYLVKKKSIKATLKIIIEASSIKKETLFNLLSIGRDMTNLFSQVKEILKKIVMR